MLGVFNPFRTYRNLRSVGVLGINQRNIDYIQTYNKRKNFPLVDDKLHTKFLAEKAGLAVPELYGTIERYGKVREIHQLLEPYKDFVIKPAHGSGGNGILVVSGKRKDNYRTIDGSILTEEELKYHVLNILSGMFSLGGHTDQALIEYRVKFDPAFDELSYLGVPDIRIIVLLGVPVMAMLRLPTKASRGKANLHQGAIGVGINMATGKTVAAVSQEQVITEHPDTASSVIDVQIPQWNKLLHLAAQTYELTGLGYQGVDIVLDKDQGPLILELNARPGLSIQTANVSGLLPRLRKVEAFQNGAASVEERVAFALENF